MRSQALKATKRPGRCGYLVVLVLSGILLPSARSEPASTTVREELVTGPHDIQIKLRMEGPYTADVPLQVVCYFKYTPEGARRMTGAPVELDKKLGGVIGAIRERGEFAGDTTETLLIISPPNSIKAKALLLIGLGDEESLSLKVLEQVGKTAIREAARLGISRVAFAPLIRDQGNSKFGAGDVERAVIRGMLLAYETEISLQKEHLAKPYSLNEWIVEAGPAYFDDTKLGVQQGIADAKAIVDRRPAVTLIHSK